MNYTEEEMTPWFPCKESPVHVGVYQSDYDGRELLGIQFAHWDGRKWGCFGDSAEDAEFYSNLTSMYSDLRWRGLLARPATTDKEQP